MPASKLARMIPLRFAAVSFWLAASLLTAQNARVEDKSVFAGFVYDSVSRQPIPKASIRVFPRGAGRPGYVGMSDAEGRFRFEAIRPGDYTVLVRNRGYSSQEEVTLKSGRIVTVVGFDAGEPVEEASVGLDPKAVITGRVVDFEGAPVSGGLVSLVVDQWHGGIRTFGRSDHTETDDRGEYRLSVVPGRHIVRAEWSRRGSALHGIFASNPGEQPQKVGGVFYPNVTEVRSASPIRVQPGEHRGGVDFKLPLVNTYHARGVVHAKGLPPTTLFIARRRDGDRSGSNYGGQVDKDGKFDIAGLTPGNYWVELFPPGPRPSGRVPVDITDRDVNDITVPGIMPFELKGRVRFDQDGSETSLSAVKLRVQVLDWYQYNIYREVSPNPDGTLSFPNLTSGEYILSHVGDTNFYVKSVTYGGSEVSTLDLTGGPLSEVEIVLGKGKGQVDGKLRSSEMVPGALAVIVSVNGVTGNTSAGFATIDDDGQFRFRVPPGRYIVFAGPALAFGLWQNMSLVEEIRSRGVEVEVPAKGSVQVEVPSFTSEDVRSAIERLGI